MSQYGTIYKGEWLMMDDSTTVQARIYDTENIIDDADTPNVIPLTMGGRPMNVKVINNGRDKFGILAKQAVLEVLSTQSINADTFVDSTDQRWLFEAKVNDTTTIFKGFIVLSELMQPDLPNPQVFTLTASDNLGLLSERKLITSTGEAPTGKNRIADYLAWALAQTGLNLNINVVNNIIPGTGTATISIGNFSSTSNTIFFPVATDYQPQMYVGQRLLCTSTGANNGTTFTVTETNTAGSYIGVSPTPVHESGITNFTLTDQATGHIYDKMFLDARTFEAEIGECEDCRTVLEKIVDKNCFLTQYKGDWWIISPDEINDLDYYIGEFDGDGSLLNNGAFIQLLKQIGEGGDSHWINRSQIIEFDRPNKFAKHTFNFDYPKEIPCNVDFSKGDELPGGTATEKNFEVDCWTLRRGRPGAYFSTTISPYTRRLYNDLNYETERNVVIPYASSASTWEYLESEEIPIEQNDRFDFSFSWRLLSTTGLAARFIRFASFMLVGDDGSYWFLGGDDSINDPAFEPGVSVFKWYNTSNFTANTSAGQIGIDFTQIDELEWQDFTWEAPKVPVSGKLFIWLNNFKQDSSSNYDKIIEYTNLSFTYHPYINGGYSKYKGQSSKAERLEAGYSANWDEDVSISDSPKRILKGGLFAEHSGVYPLQPVYWSGQQWALGQPNSTDYFQPFEYHRVNGVYNQRQRCIRYFSGDLMGLTDDWPDMVHRYRLIDASSNSSNRDFMLLEMEQNWKTGAWRGKFAETAHSSGKVFPPYEFKYITE